MSPMILVTGANGVVGYALQQRLDKERARYVSRQSKPGWLQWDLEGAMCPMNELSCSINTVIHCAPIWLLPPHLTALTKAGVRHLIVFSSTSAISKQGSDDSEEQDLVNKLQLAERDISHFCQTHRLSLYLLRPSMIYGHGRDQNVCHIARFIRRYGFALVAGKAQGLRQPVHADDLAQACLDILNLQQSDARQPQQLSFNVAGAERLTYRALVRRIALGLGKRPIVIGVPLPILRLLLQIARLFRRFDYTPNMANRMQSDLIYDNSAAEGAFSFAPQIFLTNPKRDLAG